MENTWTCLQTAEQIFRGMDKPDSVKKSLERQLAWAKRHELTDRVQGVEDKLVAL